MKVVNFNIIKLTFFLILGILIGFYYYIPLHLSVYITLCLIFLLIISYLISKNQFKKTIWFGIVTFITAVSIGILTTNIHNEKNYKNHYTKFFSVSKKTTSTITFKINEVLKPGNYHDKYIIDILKVDDKTVSGTSLLNIAKDSLQKQLEVDEILITTESFTAISPPINPNQFNYKKYLEKRYIYHQIYSTNKNLFRVSNNTHTFFGYAAQLRKNINLKLNKYHFKTDELAIINALILGQRQHIRKEVYTHYVNAGAIHILAVSGLHVGILLLLLNIFFKPLEQLKNGRILKMIVVILLLWCYTIIAGATASIVRAATMFSIIAYAMHLKRPSNIYNTLAISVFFILIFKPLFLFDVGFQLSYLAVIAIVSIQPILYKIWKPKYWLVNKLWEITTVTLAAQFGVLPISLYYFHQIPGLFWLSNIVIIPLLGTILVSGILIITLALTNVLPQFLADSFGFIIGLMNTFFEWIASKEEFLFQDIAFNIFYVLSTYLIIIALVRLYVKKNHNAVALLCLSVISCQIATMYTKYKNSKNAFIIFHKSRNTVIALKKKNTLQVFHNVDTLTKNKTISTFAVANFIKSINEDTLQDLYIYQNKKVLIVDSLSIYMVKSIQPDYVLLRNSPKINIERLIDTLSPKTIIADGSNYKSYVSRWEKTCKKRKLPFHYTGKKGAFVLKE
ncbi:ComEC family competence protein [Lacinutrix sp. C3R15]|uniref:ComEC/Rec2 family competence protein n=1 Tax=Flavobacteriaceae TaxID=49546 RepID=UPI001C086392|nr:MULTISPECIES: ComEC/Rec2 family competence protein [Flavobacteriaceae]MBU2939217.1 ComEC family competence protein [Lacinutrix sp. C3R15]MDO6622532.1 ComEC/Rec2 family competence protein [Oceanihabitans sp. 1_MG-2023]